MSGGQEKNFSTLGPKLRGNKAQQDNGDKQRQICIEVINYVCMSFTTFKHLNIFTSSWSLSFYWSRVKDVEAGVTGAIS